MSETSAVAHNGSLSLPGLTIKPEWVRVRLEHPNLRVLDVRPLDAYRAGHVPGAVRVELQSLCGEVDGVAGMLLPPGRFAEEIGWLGVGNESAGHENVVVAYDGIRGTHAARVVWALLRYGHRQAAVMSGGVEQWREAGYPTTQEETAPSPARFVPGEGDEHLAQLAWLQSRFGADDLVVLDVRAPYEFAQGHLPGAVNWDWTNGAPADGWAMMRSAEEVRAELERLGVTPEKEVVTYCRSGVRAAHTFVLLRELGYPRVRNYDGSWLEWSAKVGGGQE